MLCGWSAMRSSMPSMPARMCLGVTRRSDAAAIEPAQGNQVSGLGPGVGDGHGHGHERRGSHGHDHDSVGKRRTFRDRLIHVLGPHSHDPADSIDDAWESSEKGIRAVKISLVALGATSLVQLAVVAVSGSVALLADSIHNYCDALTALPLWLAFAVGRRSPSRRYALRLRTGRGPGRSVRRGHDRAVRRGGGL